MKLFLAFLCTLKCFHLGCSYVFSNFRETEIFDEVAEYSLMASDADASVLTCARECLRDKNCRRFKWCEDDVTSGQCRLYEDGQHCPHNGDGRKCFCFMKKLGYDDGIYTCPIGYYGDPCDQVIKHCSEGRLHGMETLGNKLSFIQPEGSPEPFEILCEFQYGGLTTIQSRNLYASPVNFNRTLDDYINGFGRPRLNFWLGLKRISLISKQSATKCNMEIIDSRYCQVYYVYCHIYDQTDNYKLFLSTYSTADYGTRCGNSMLSTDNVNDAPFSTYDVDNSNKCAAKMGAGWWYADTTTCTQGNLNAPLVPSHQVTADPDVMRMKWEHDLGSNVITISTFRLMRTDV